MKKSLFLILMIMTLFMCNKVYAYKEYEIGDEITYRDELYYVIENSNKDENYITLLKDIPLTVEEVNSYSTDYVSEIGEYPYYMSDECNETSQTGCSTDYNISSIKKIIDKWSSSFSDDLISVDGYKTRLINESEISDNTEEWLFSSDYWTMYTTNNNVKINVTFFGNIYLNKIYCSELMEIGIFIRPVINLNKCVLDDNDIKCINEYNENIDSNDVNENNDLSNLYESYNIGDDITYNNELYHVIKNSNENSNYLTLLKDKPLTVHELNIYGKDNSGSMFINKYLKNESGNIFEYEDGSGGISYATRVYCGDKKKLSDYTTTTPSGEHYEIRYCTTEYDASNVSKVINKWAFNFDKDLVKVNGYKVSLVDYSIYDEIKEYDWAKTNKYKYWTKNSRGKTGVYAISDEGLVVDKLFNKNAVRPVINLNKCAVEKNNPNCNNDILVKSCSTEKVNHYKEYQAGDEINYHGSKYHVMENSSTSKNYVTLFKDDSLTLNDLPNYKDNILNNMKLSNNVGYTQFLCDGTPCIDYENSNIKNIIENWTKFNFNENDLVEVGGYKSRIISEVDVLDNLGYSLGDTGSGHYIYYSSKDVPLVFPEIAAWTMFVIDDNYLLYTYDKSFDNEKDKDAYNIIIPVINVKKEVFNKISYNLGEQITYNNEQYYIISKDSPDKNYITLIRVKPFNQGEITLYQSDKNIFSIPYYISDTCNSGSNLSGCSSNFDKSEVKKIIDMWTQSFNDDLVEVEGYKARIPSKYDFIYNFYYDMDNVYATSYVYCSSNDTPKWVNIGYPYWSMEVFEDSNSLVYQNMKNGCLEIYNMLYPQHYSTTYQSSSIRPVINVNKCAIGGCYETEECINDEKPSTTETIVEVAKTLKNIPKIILIICSVLVISGSAFIIYNYFKSKKERK